MFVLAFDKPYIIMGRALINSLNYYHNVPKIVIYTTDYTDIKEAFPQENVEIINFPKYRYSYFDWHPLIWAKLDAFALTSNEPIIFMDVDILMYSNISIFIEHFKKSNSKLAACQDDDSFIEQFSQFPQELSLYANHKALNAGIILFYPDIDIYQTLIHLADKYHQVTRFPEQAILNIFCAQHLPWFDLGESLVVYPYDKRVATYPFDFSLLHFYAPRPSFFGCMGFRNDELSLLEQVFIFEENFKAKYPMEQLETDFKIRHDNLLGMEDAIKNEIMRSLLPDGTFFQVVKILEGWNSNIRWKVQVDNKFYFLKEKIDTFSEADFKFKLHFQNEIYKINKYIVPALVNDRDGNPYVKCLERYFEVQDWFDGHCFIPINNQDYFKIGKLLADFASASHLFTIENNYSNLYASKKFPEYPIDIRNYFLLHAKEKIALTEYPAFHEMEQWIESIDTEVFSQLTRHFIHADCYTSNILVNELNELILIDLDDIHYGFSITDLSLAISAYCGFYYNESNSRPYSVKKFDFIASCEIIRGFDAYHPLTLIEKNLLPIFIRLNYIRLFIDCLYLDDPIPVPLDIDEQIMVFHQNINSINNLK